jgi:hypothetical protein
MYGEPIYHMAPVYTGPVRATPVIERGSPVITVPGPAIRPIPAAPPAIGPGPGPQVVPGNPPMATPEPYNPNEP